MSLKLVVMLTCMDWFGLAKGRISINNLYFLPLMFKLIIYTVQHELLNY